MRDTLKYFLVVLLAAAIYADIVIAGTNSTPKRIYYLSLEDQLCSINYDGSDNKCYGFKVQNIPLSFSPDGKFVAVISSTHDIILLNTRTHKKRKLVSDEYDKMQIEWSPDSRKLAYVVIDLDTNNDHVLNYRDKGSIYIVDIYTGSKTSTVKGFASWIDPIHWSRHGDSIYFVNTIGNLTGTKAQYIRYDLKRHKQHLIKEAESGRVSEIKIFGYSVLHFNQQSNLDSDEAKPADFLPEINKIVFEQRGEIVLEDCSTHKVSTLVPFRGYDFKTNSGFFNPRWLDDSRIIYCGPSATPHPLKRQRSIYIYDISTNKLTLLTTGGSPGWYRNPTSFRLKRALEINSIGECPKNEK